MRKVASREQDPSDVLHAKKGAANLLMLGRIIKQRLGLKKAGMPPSILQ